MKQVMAFLALALATASPAAVPAQADEAPVVVELFTSQGCNSCPPADRMLGELAAREGVLALSFHVDYWDYLGWKDTLASPAATERQRAYAAALGSRYVYTPQMVIDGRRQVVGADAAAVARMLAAGAPGNVRALGIERLSSGEVVVTLPAGPGPAAVLWLIRYDPRHEVSIAHGENGGRTITYHNVVRDIRAAGQWPDGPGEIRLAATVVGTGPVALLLQQAGNGPILAAARLPAQPDS